MTRRGLLAAGGLVIASSCRRVKGTGFPGYLLVATAGEKSLAVADLTAFRLVKQIGLEAEPTAIVPAGPEGRNFVLTPSTGSVQVLSASLEPERRLRLANQLLSIRLASRRLLALAEKPGELIEVDARTLAVVRRYKLAAGHRYLDASQDGMAALSSGPQGVLELVDMRTGRTIRREMQGAIGDLRFRADGKLLLVANLKEQALSCLSVPDLKTVADLPLPMQPQNLCFNADQGQLLISGEGMDAVSIVFPYRILEVEQTVLAGRDPGVMACSETPAYLFVASASGSDVSVMNLDNRRVLGIVQVGLDPSFIAVTPDSQYALVLNRGSGDVAVIHIPAVQAKTGNAAKMRTKSGASLFTVFPIGSKPVHAAVVSRYS